MPYSNNSSQFKETNQETHQEMYQETYQDTHQETNQETNQETTYNVFQNEEYNEFLQITPQYGSQSPDETRLFCNNVKSYQCQNCFAELDDMLEFIDHQIENGHSLAPKILMKPEFLDLIESSRVMNSATGLLNCSMLKSTKAVRDVISGLEDSALGESFLGCSSFDNSKSNNPNFNDDNFNNDSFNNDSFNNFDFNNNSSFNNSSVNKSSTCINHSNINNFSFNNSSFNNTSLINSTMSQTNFNQALLSSLNTTHSKSFFCQEPDCDFVGFSCLQLSAHTRSTHYKSKCLECGKTYANAKCLKQHRQRVHDKCIKVNCGLCGKGFYSKGALKGHTKNCRGRDNGLRENGVRENGVRQKMVLSQGIQEKYKLHCRMENCSAFYTSLHVTSVNARRLRHERGHCTEDRYECYYCGGKFEEFTSFSSHLRDGDCEYFTAEQPLNVLEAQLIGGVRECFV